jgi:multiple sugar transport system ATP-binding protein
VASIAFDHVSKVYPDGTRAVNDLSLEVHDGEFVVLVGPSGCGKTTALRMIAGLEEISDGEVRIGDRIVNDLEPRERDIAMVFQNYALYPNMTAFDNIAFGLRMRKIPKEQRAPKVEEAARILGLSELLNRKPGQLSGGQRQRVAMGRAIVREPQAFLMDEPLSNLDAKLRVQMRAEIARIQHELGVTTVYVTHDQVEAMTMGDRVAVMRHGELQQTDAPQRLYDRPGNLFVASFIGSPAMNLLEAEVVQRNGGLAVKLGEDELALPAETLAKRPALQFYAGRTVAVGIRPEHVREADRSADGAVLHGTTRLTEALGSELLAHVEIGAARVVREEVLEGAIVDEAEKSVVADLLTSEGGRRTTIVGKLDPGARLRKDERATLAVDTRRLHFFDLETGFAISA